MGAFKARHTWAAVAGCQPSAEVLPRVRKGGKPFGDLQQRLNHEGVYYEGWARWPKAVTVIDR
jgi:hypothetical protein